MVRCIVNTARFCPKCHSLKVLVDGEFVCMACLERRKPKKKEKDEDYIWS